MVVIIIIIVKNNKNMNMASQGEHVKVGLLIKVPHHHTATSCRTHSLKAHPVVSPSVTNCGGGYGGDYAQLDVCHLSFALIKQNTVLHMNKLTASEQQ